MGKLIRVLVLVSLVIVTSGLSPLPATAVGGCEYCKLFELGAMPDFGLEDESFFICWPELSAFGPRYCETYVDGRYCSEWGRCEVFTA
jgi:hypothetical protein